MARIKLSPLIAAVTLSLAASLAMSLAPFLVPNMPIGPIIILNWLLLALVTILTRRPIQSQTSFPRSKRAALNIWRLVIIAFAASGWIAISNGSRIL